MAKEFEITRKIAEENGIPESVVNLVIGKATADNAYSKKLDTDVAQFIYQVARTGLDPIARQIYLVFRSGSGVTQTGIDGYRLIAGRTGLYAGSSDPVFDGGMNLYENIKNGEGKGHPITATITVRKLVGNAIGEFTASAAWDQYCPKSGDTMWRKMPHVMLAKVAEALALRKAFPAELSGVYVDAEMDQASDQVSRKKQEEETQSFVNDKAESVYKLMKGLGVDPNSERVTEFLGGEITSIPDTEESTERLRALYRAVKSGEFNE